MSSSQKYYISLTPPCGAGGVSDSMYTYIQQQMLNVDPTVSHSDVLATEYFPSNVASLSCVTAETNCGRDYGSALVEVREKIERERERDI